jgi:hypothetical protein
MCPVVYLGKMPEVKVGVDLRRRDVGVSEKLLDTAKIVARFEKMSREGVAQQVRIDAGVDALTLRPVIHTSLHRACTQSSAAITDKQGHFIGVGETCARPEPLLQRGPCHAADRQNSFFVAFAGDPYGGIGQVELAEIQPGQLGQP